MIPYLSMGREYKTDEVFDFRIQFHHLNSDFINERHFTAQNSQSAIEMFEFACRKDDIEVEIDDVTRWNRWANRWENVEELME